MHGYSGESTDSLSCIQTFPLRVELREHAGGMSSLAGVCLQGFSHTGDFTTVKSFLTIHEKVTITLSANFSSPLEL